jgi:hypothetical protein
MGKLLELKSGQGKEERVPRRLGKMVLDLWLIHFMREQGQLLWKMVVSTE